MASVCSFSSDFLDRVEQAEWLVPLVRVLLGIAEKALGALVLDQLTVLMVSYGPRRYFDLEIGQDRKWKISARGSRIYCNT